MAITTLEDEVMNKLIKLCKHTNVTLRWIRAHKGAADCLAKVGLLDLDLDLQPVVVSLVKTLDGKYKLELELEGCSCDDFGLCGSSAN